MKHRIIFVHKHGRRFIVLYTNMAAVTSCENDLLFSVKRVEVKVLLLGVTICQFAPQSSHYPPVTSETNQILLRNQNCLPTMARKRCPFKEKVKQKCRGHKSITNRHCANSEDIRSCSTNLPTIFGGCVFHTIFMTMILRLLLKNGLMEILI